MTERIYDTTQNKSSSLSTCKKGFFLLLTCFPELCLDQILIIENHRSQYFPGKIFSYFIFLSNQTVLQISFSFPSLHLIWFLIWRVTNDEEEWIRSLGSLGRYSGNLALCGDSHSTCNTELLPATITPPLVQWKSEPSQRFPIHSIENYSFPFPCQRQVFLICGNIVTVLGWPWKILTTKKFELAPETTLPCQPGSRWFPRFFVSLDYVSLLKVFVLELRMGPFLPDESSSSLLFWFIVLVFVELLDNLPSTMPKMITPDLKSEIYKYKL